MIKRGHQFGATFYHRFPNSGQSEILEAAQEEANGFDYEGTEKDTYIDAFKQGFADQAKAESND